MRSSDDDENFVRAEARWPAEASRQGYGQTRPHTHGARSLDQALHGLRVLNAEEVAEALDCDVDTVNRRAASGDLPGIKIGRSWAFPIQALEDCLNEMAKIQMKTRKNPPSQIRMRNRPGRTAPSLD